MEIIQTLNPKLLLARFFLRALSQLRARSLGGLGCREAPEAFRHAGAKFRVYRV